MDPYNVKSALVVGAGVMGHSIAQVFAQAGIEVNLVDLDKRTLEHAMSLIKANIETLTEFGRVTGDETGAIMARVHQTTDMASAAGDVDFAIEAVVEVPDVKEKVFTNSKSPVLKILSSPATPLHWISSTLSRCGKPSDWLLPTGSPRRISSLWSRLFRGLRHRRK